MPYVNDFRYGTIPVRRVYLNNKIIWERILTHDNSKIKFVNSNKYLQAYSYNIFNNNNKYEINADNLHQLARTYLLQNKQNIKTKQQALIKMNETPVIKGNKIIPFNYQGEHSLNPIINCKENLQEDINSNGNIYFNSINIKSKDNSIIKMDALMSFAVNRINFINQIKFNIQSSIVNNSINIKSSSSHLLQTNPRLQPSYSFNSNSNNQIKTKISSSFYNNSVFNFDQKINIIPNIKSKIAYKTPNMASDSQDCTIRLSNPTKSITTDYQKSSVSEVFKLTSSLLDFRSRPSIVSAIKFHNYSENPITKVNNLSFKKSILQQDDNSNIQHCNTPILEVKNKINFTNKIETRAPLVSSLYTKEQFMAFKEKDSISKLLPPIYTKNYQNCNIKTISFIKADNSNNLYNNNSIRGSISNAIMKKYETVSNPKSLNSYYLNNKSVTFKLLPSIRDNEILLTEEQLRIEQKIPVNGNELKINQIFGFNSKIQNEKIVLEVFSGNE